MKYGLRSLMIGVISTAFLAGCSGPAIAPSAKPVGKWRINVSGMNMKMLAEPDGPVEAGEEEYKGDGTLVTTASDPINEKMTGTWKYVKSEGSVVVLLVKLPGIPERERRLEFTDDDHFILLPSKDATEASKNVTVHCVRIK